MFKKGLALSLGLLLALPLWAALEVGTYIDDLVVTNPTASDHYATADDHLRLLKQTIKNTFPSIDGVVSTTQAELNVLDGATLSTAELNTLDGVTATAAELNALDGITTTVTELNYVDGVTSALQTQLDAKVDESVFPNVAGNVTPTHTELNFVDGVTSAIQTQLDAKVNTSRFPNVNANVTATDEELNQLAGVTVDAGTYTPTVLYVQGSGPSGCSTGVSISTTRYMRIDNVVSVSGTLSCSGVTGGGDFYLTLPVASNLSSSSHVTGSAPSNFESCIALARADTAGDRARFEYPSVPCTATSYTFQFAFTYTVL